ncbi:MAG: DegT/DnrJ/EryC1/StrS aminotransferase family protein [Thermoplasmatales archaeon]|nr:DegT/DnrJ/EryC1/StrS aminotransferase family protein [Thermoplasmatales archaeon]
MIPRFKPNFNYEEIISLINNKKDAIKTFEEKFAYLVNSKYAITFPSGRFGLYALIKSLKIHDEIIIPGFTCIVVPASIVASNCKPVFVDISLENFNIRTNEIKSVFSEKTKAVIPTHMYGYPADIKTIRNIVGEDTYIIEDAAQAILTKDVGKFGDAVFYSFNFEKQLFTFGGGMVTTNNEEIYKKLMDFKINFLPKTKSNNNLNKTISLLYTKLIFSDILFDFFSRTWDANALRIWRKNKWEFDNIDLPLKEIYLSSDFNNTFLRVQAAVGISQLDKIKNDIKKRYEIAKIYNDKLKNLESINLPLVSDDCSYAHYTIMVNNRDKFEGFMRKKGIQINKVFEYSIPHVPYFSHFVKDKDLFRNTYTASKNNVNLPVYPQLFDKPHKITKIINNIKKYFEK